MSVSAVFALANLMNVKEDHSQLSAIARYPYGHLYLTKSDLSSICFLNVGTLLEVFTAEKEFQ